MAKQKKYESLRNELIEFIRKKKLKQNDRLPTVREILRNSDYSYATLNRTLIEMEQEGLITKRQGKGLFVNRLAMTGESNTQIALIIPKDFSAHRIFIDILAGVRKAVEKANLDLVVAISNMSHEKEKETIEKLLRKKVEGMIIFLEDHYHDNYSHITDLKKRKYPFVLIDRFIPELDTDYVVINNWDAMFKVCSYLKYKRACDKILFIPSNDTSIMASSSDEKTLGYKNAVRALYDDQTGTVMRLTGFVSKIDRLCKQYQNLGVCLNHDTMIPDLHKKLVAARKKIPANCHIFGYNNSYEPPLYPTVEQFNDRVGMKATEILIEKIKNPDRPSAKVRIDPKLVLPDGHGKYYLEN